MHPRDSHAGKLDPQGCGSLWTFVDTVLVRLNSSPATTRNQRVALRHLARALGEESAEALPLVVLSSENLTAALADLIGGGMTPATAAVQRRNWLTIATAAYAVGHLPALPECPAVAVSRRKEQAPWSVWELERLFASARSLKGLVGELPAAGWWGALLAVLLETQLTIAEVLALPRTAYDRHSGRLHAGTCTYQLHPRAVAQLEAIRFHNQEKLIPWPFDNGQAPFHMLLRRYRELLHRVDLAPVTGNLFRRLQLTARLCPGVLGQLNLERKVPLQLEPLKFPRRRDLVVQQRRSDADAAPQKRRKLKQESLPTHYRISIRSPRTLREFFEASYRPQRLADAAAGTVEQYREVIAFLSDFLACDATVDCLSDDLLERFMAHRKELGRSNSTLNRYRCYLLALWRHAWRKKLVAELPRDVFKYNVPKRLPEAWSTAEVSRLLAAAAETPGSLCGIPAGPYWVALILTLYDTGLRITALMSARCEQLSAEGWLSIPAEDQKQDADQAFRLHPDTLAAIRVTRPESRELLFPFPYSLEQRHPIRERYREILKRAGLACGRRDLFHKLRRTSATAVCDAFDEVTASRHLGHSSLEVTRRYIDPRQLTRKQTAAEVITRPALDAPVTRPQLGGPS